MSTKVENPRLISRREFLAVIGIGCAAALQPAQVQAQEPISTPNPPIDSAAFSDHTYLSIVKKEKSPEQVNWEIFTDIMGRLLGHDMIPPAPQIEIITEYNVGEPIGTAEFVATAIRFAQIAEDFNQHYTEEMKQVTRSGWEPSNGKLSKLSIAFSKRDLSHGGISSFLDDKQNEKQLLVEEGSIFALARLFTETLVPDAQIGGGLGTSDSVREMAVSRLALVIFEEYQRRFLAESDLGVIPPMIRLKDELGNFCDPAIPSYLLVPLYKQQLEKELHSFKNRPTDYKQPVANQLLVGSDGSTTNWYENVLLQFNGGTFRAEGNLFYPFTREGDKIVEETIAAWEREGSAIQDPALFRFCFKILFSQGSDVFHLWKPFTDAKGWTELIANIREKLLQSGFLLTDQAYQKAIVEVKDFPNQKHPVAIYFVYGDMDYRGGFTINSAWLERAYTYDKISVKLNRIEDAGPIKKYPIIHGYFYVTYQGESFWVKVPPAGTMPVNNQEMQVVFSPLINFTASDGSPASIDLTGIPTYMEIQAEQIELNDDGTKRVTTFQQRALFEPINDGVPGDQTTQLQLESANAVVGELVPDKPAPPLTN